MAIDLKYFKDKLEKEKTEIEKNLGAIAHKDIKNPDDWIPDYPDIKPQASDQGEMSQVTEQYEAQYSVETVLEERLNEIKSALKRIEEGEYGTCEKDKKAISQERLEANPATKYCLTHAYLE